MNIDNLKPNPNNPRILTKVDYEILKKKITIFPQMLEKRPIVYIGDTVLGGNQRLMVLKALAKEGFEIKDSYFSDASDWTEEQKKQFILTDNINDGEWNWEILANEWDEVKLKEWGIPFPPSWGTPDNPDKEWSGMPEFEQRDLSAYKQIIVSFTSEEDMSKFSEIVGQKIQITTKGIWYPEVKYEKRTDKAFVDKKESNET